MSERHKMNKGWLELESDPGLFTLLLEDFGVKGVQVEEIYDLQKPFEGQVYGFIFLFKWIEERRSRRKLTQEEESLVMDDKVVNSMFFAKQVIPNSCATHALLSVMLNSEHSRLGDTLADLKKFTADMNPEDKGYAIGNMPDLARAHNSHARPEPNMLPEKQQGISAVRTMEAFHFVSYVPVNGHLFELDGLKPYPIDHGPWSEKENWTEKFRRVISERLGMATGGEPYHDIRFNLMAVVPDRREQYQRKLDILKTNRHIVLEALQRMVKVTNPSIHNDPTATSRSVKQIKAEPIITRSVAAAVREATAAAANEKPLASYERSTKLGSRSTRASHRSSGFDDLAASDILIPSDVAEVTTETASSTPVRLPPELDSHNYAKSPDMELMDTGSQASEDGSVNVDGSDDDSDVDAENDGEEHSLARQTQLQVTQEGPLKMKISLAGGPHVSSVTALPRTPIPPPGGNTSTDSGDVTKPLTVQTKFNDGSPGPSSSSTDTASEVGSFLNSPTNSLNASSEPSPGTSPGSKPGLDISLEQQYALAEAPLNVKTEDIQQLMDISASVSQMQAGQTDGVSAVSLQSAGPEGSKVSDIEKKKSQHKGFSPKDLVALLKNIEQEIKTCDINLHDEIEKRRKYQMDDCRRTHNYDQFICMFLSMLAEQGHLGELVEEHMLVKRRQGVNVGSLHKAARPERRRRSRPKKRR